MPTAIPVQVPTPEITKTPSNEEVVVMAALSGRTAGDTTAKDQNNVMTGLAVTHPWI